MLPPMITGWPVSRYSAGSPGMPAAEGAGRALAVHQQLARVAVDHVASPAWRCCGPRRRPSACPALRGSRRKTSENTSRMRCRITWRLAKAMLAAHFMAAK